MVYVKGKKTSLDDNGLLPEITILDSPFVETTPRYLKACSAIDTYCQAIESYFAKKATEESRDYALQALSLCKNYMEDAVCSNEKMPMASHLSGKAINISRTTVAHALSYDITERYGIPHGHAVFLSIMGLLKKNLPYIRAPFLLLKAMGVIQKKKNAL